MKSVMEDMVANGEAKSNAGAKSFFDGEKAMAGTASLYVHVSGMDDLGVLATPLRRTGFT